MRETIRNWNGVYYFFSLFLSVFTSESSNAIGFNWILVSPIMISIIRLLRMANALAESNHYIHRLISGMLFTQLKIRDVSHWNIDVDDEFAKSFCVRTKTEFCQPNFASLLIFCLQPDEIRFVRNNNSISKSHKYAANICVASHQKVKTC